LFDIPKFKGGDCPPLISCDDDVHNDFGRMTNVFVSTA